VVKEALQTHEAACVAQVIQLIREMAAKGDSMPVQQLAEIIARDLTTMSKVLRVANTLGYNPEGVEVTTITQAINVIGFEKVRNLAVSLLLVENAEGHVVSQESRDVAGLALASGLVAQSVMEQKGLLDPEQSFVCAALRNYGRLLLTTFLLEDYRRARSLVGPLDPDTAYRSVFGLTPLDLGYEILHSAQLPRRILRCLQVLPSERMSSSLWSSDDRLMALAEFSVKLCELVHETGTSPEAFERGSANLLARYGRALALTSKELTQILKVVDRKLTAFGTAQGLRGFTSPLIKNIGALAAKEEPAGAGAAPGINPTKAAATEPLPKDILLAGLAEVAQLMATQPVDLEKVLDATRRCIQSAFKLTHCLVFFKNANSQTYSALVGGGALFDQIRGQPLLDPRRTDVFNAALVRGDDVTIQNADDPKVRPFIPDWLHAAGRNRQLLLLPIRDEEGTFALILGVSGPATELTTPLKQQLKLLRGHVAFVRGLG
jgi:hypothetical protein